MVARGSENDINYSAKNSIQYNYLNSRIYLTTLGIGTEMCINEIFATYNSVRQRTQNDDQRASVMSLQTENEQALARR